MSSFVLFLQLFCRSAEEPFPGFSEVGSQRSLLFLYLLARLFLHTFIYSLHILKVFFFALTENTVTSPVLSLRPAGLDSFHLSSLLIVRGRVLKIKK